MHSSHGRFIKSSAVRKTGEKLGIYQDLARGGFLSILMSRTKDEQVIISCPGDGSNSARAGDRRTAKEKGRIAPALTDIVSLSAFATRAAAIAALAAQTAVALAALFALRLLVAVIARRAAMDVLLVTAMMA